MGELTAFTKALASLCRLLVLLLELVKFALECYEGWMGLLLFVMGLR